MLEVIIETLQDAITAEQAKVDRFELVSALCDGGLTPSIALIEHVTQRTNVPVRVMLRPHGRSFIYDAYDQDVILRDLEVIKSTKAEGIVFGALTEEGKIDEVLLSKVITHKGHLKLTFHRAIDEAADYEQAIHALLNYPIDTILTSGGQNSALDAISVYQKYYPTLLKHDIECLAGKGITLDNLPSLIKETRVRSIHMGGGVKTNQAIDPHKIKAVLKLIHQVNL